MVLGGPGSGEAWVLPFPCPLPPYPLPLHGHDPVFSDPRKWTIPEDCGPGARVCHGVRVAFVIHHSVLSNQFDPPVLRSICVRIWGVGSTHLRSEDTENVQPDTPEPFLPQVQPPPPGGTAPVSIPLGSLYQSTSVQMQSRESIQIWKSPPPHRPPCLKNNHTCKL